MLTVYQTQSGALRASVLEAGQGVPPDAVWIDLYNPTAEERETVRASLRIDMPTRADMEEIEISSRLYQEDGAIFMTALIMANAETEAPAVDVVTFVLQEQRLLTIRYIDPQPFRTFSARCERGVVSVGSQVPLTRGEGVLAALLDVIIDRMADILERMGADIEAISRGIFDPNDKLGARDFTRVLRALGRKHDLSGKLRESLLTVTRILSFLAQATDGKGHKDMRAHIKTLTRDVQSLLDHASYLAGKLSYLQDGTLGLINNEQNNIIKIMSVAAMVFLPPTLFASIWGMNFHNMPELNEPWAYPVSIVIMVVSAVVPYWLFKRRGWL